MYLKANTTSANHKAIGVLRLSPQSGLGVKPGIEDGAFSKAEELFALNHTVAFGNKINASEQYPCIFIAYKKIHFTFLTAAS